MVCYDIRPLWGIIGCSDTTQHSTKHKCAGEEDMNDGLMRRQDVEKVTALSRSTIYRKMKDGTFPRPVEVNPGMVRWKESGIQAWMDSLPVTGGGSAGGGALDGETPGARLGTPDETSLDSLRSDLLQRGSVDAGRSRRARRRPRKRKIQDQRGGPARPVTHQPPSEDGSER